MDSKSKRDLGRLLEDGSPRALFIKRKRRPLPFAFLFFILLIAGVIVLDLYGVIDVKALLS